MPKFFKISLFEPDPKLITITLYCHFKWGEPCIKLKKNDTERKQVSRLSLKIVFNNFRGHITFGASCMLKKRFAYVAFGQSKISDLYPKIAIKQDVSCFKVEVDNFFTVNIFNGCDYLSK